MSKFIEEIQQQPESLKRTFEFYTSDKGHRILRELKSKWNSPDCSRVIFTGMGSSFYLACTAARLLDGLKVPVLSIETGELLHDSLCSIVPGTLLILISQSGESYEIKALLDLVQKRKAALEEIVGITNDTSSTLAVRSGICIPLWAGKEECTSTKTFVSTFLLILMLDKYLREDTLDRNALLKMFEESGSLVAGSDRFDAFAETFGNCSFVQCIGRGVFSAVAEQTALMFMEVAKIPSAASSGGAFRHGPIEAVNDGFTAVVFTHSQAPTYEQCLGLASDILLFGGRVLLVTDKSSGLQGEHLFEFVVSCNHPEFAALLYVIPMQLLLAKAAAKKGLEPGTFSHGHKITGIE